MRLFAPDHYDMMVHLVIGLINSHLDEDEYIDKVLFMKLSLLLSLLDLKTLFTSFGRIKRIYGLLHGKCARTVFTHELLAYQKTNE